jgi:DNA-binding response OmpR family regulator
MGKAESAKGYLEDSNPDLIVLDLSPNGFDAWDVLQEIGGKRHHLPVLIRITTLDKTQ